MKKHTRAMVNGFESLRKFAKANGCTLRIKGNDVMVCVKGATEPFCEHEVLDPQDYEALRFGIRDYLQAVDECEAVASKHLRRLLPGCRFV